MLPSASWCWILGPSDYIPVLFVVVLDCLYLFLFCGLDLWELWLVHVTHDLGFFGCVDFFTFGFLSVWTFGFVGFVIF